MSQIVINGDNIEVLKSYPDNHFDSVVTDPPYGLGKEPDALEVLRSWADTGFHEVKGSGFMGKEWDAFVPQPLFWKEVFRVLKHGGHVVAFYGTRTYDWGVMAMRVAGFEVRDCIQWIYGSGFPKSHNISKAIDKLPKANNRLQEFAELLKTKRFENGLSISEADELITGGSTMYSFLEGRNVEGCFKVYAPNKIHYEKIVEVFGLKGWDDIVENNLEIVGHKDGNFGYQKNSERWTESTKITASTTDAAKKWEGWGSALKPAHEDLVLARKPFQFSSEFVYLYESLIYNLKIQICQSKLFAKDVKEIFTLSQKELQGGKLDFVRWSAEKPFNTKEDLLVLMDMLQLELKEGNMTLNIVLSWLNILADLWSVANIYITETELSTITELRILNSLEWESIFQNITLLKDKKINGLDANVLTAESVFSVLNLKLSDILIHSAKENVISKGKEKDFVPNSEPIVLARKPLEKGLSVAENVLKYGTGGINIDGCRVGLSSNDDPRLGGNGSWKTDKAAENVYEGGYEGKDIASSPLGRFPANLIMSHHPECECKGTKKISSDSHHTTKYNGKKTLYEGGWEEGEDMGNKFADADGKETIEDWQCHEECPIRIMDEQSGVLKSGAMKKSYEYKNNGNSLGKATGFTKQIHEANQGGASRFFYCAKASKSERNKGLVGFEEKQGGGMSGTKDKSLLTGSGNERNNLSKNFHPTVKPVKLMQYLVRLVTPPNGLVLDPFCGSGTTGIACKLEGFQFVGIEQDAEYTKIAQARITKFDDYDELEPESEQETTEVKEEAPKKYNLIQTSLF